MSIPFKGKTINASLIVLAIILSGIAAGCGIAITPPSADDGRETYTPPSLVESKLEDPRLDEIDSALRKAVEGRDDVVAFLIYEVVIHRVDFTKDGSQGVVWLALVDPDTSELVPAEPGIALARQLTAGEWEVTLQADPEFVEVLKQIPEDILDKQMRKRYLPGVQKAPKVARVYSGYLLPWKGGESRRVSGSIGHVFTYKTCPATCLFAFDFADGTMFPVHAARSGRVKYAVWHHPNNNMKNANYLVLEDTSTVPTTYQIYYHFAQDSIPPASRVRGAEVLQGQFIGIADNTGPSTGHHLHFHVHTNANAYWGSSVDITFDDVKINGGRPRTCTEAKNFPKYGTECTPGNWLLSGNGDMERPTGGISQPSAGTVINKATRSVSGWGRDDKAVQSMQLLVTYDGNWKPIGPVLKESPFTIPIDLCKAGIPDGEFFLSLQVMDTSGKLSQPLTGLTPLIKQYDCFPSPTPTPMPGCIPAEDGAAVYTGANYQGSCSTLKIGEYAKRSRFGDLGGKSIRSILVGSNAAVELFAGENFTGERLVVFESQPDIEKYLVGADGVDSIIIRQRPAVPAPPVLVSPLNVDGLAPDDTDQLTLTWNGAEEAEEHRSELFGAEGFKRAQEWQKEKRWNVGALPAGEYTWTVWSRNISGESSASINFQVDLLKPLPESQLELLAKLTRLTAVELRWVIIDEASPAKFEIQYRVTGSEWKDWRSEIEGSQRRVWFFGKPGKHYEFRMRAVGANGKAEPYPEFAEAETEIEAECTSDGFDVSLPGNNDPGNPTPLDVGVNQSHNICGPGDQDWIVFMGEMGKSYRIQTTPDGGAAVIIELYGGENASLLGSQSPSDLGKTTRLDWIAPEDGLYYLRLQPIDERLSGTETGYTLRIDPMGQVYTPTLLCGGLALPGLWVLVKLILALRTRMRRE